MGTNNSNKTRQLREFFEKSVDCYPDNIALICDEQSLSYQMLEQRANQLAHYLLSQGVCEKHTIGILLERSLDSYIAILAVLKVGAAYVPIEIEYPNERINYILADLPFHAVITSATQFKRQDAISFPKTFVLEVLTADIEQQSIERPALPSYEPDKLCYVIYTSGSTGKPKGVEITQDNICHYVTVASNLYRITPQDRIYQGFSLAFDASLEEVWMAFANGGTLVACCNKEIRSGVGLIDFLNEHRVTVFSTVPTLLSTLEGHLPHLRLLILGGEACTASLIKRWSRKGLTIMNTYGPTEATVISTYTECHAHKPITIGKPLPGYEVFILDEQLKPVPPGESGELCIAGFGIARGYVNRPDITANRFVHHPDHAQKRLYRTGDLGRINAEGDIEFMGRIDDQIKLRGFRIELNEIEAVMMGFEAITQAVVVLQELDHPILVAYLIVDKTQVFDIHAFKRFLIGRLPHYMMPASFELVETFPLLSSGKVNRKALPKPEITLEAEHYVAPSTEMEATIVRIWEDYLQYSNLSVEADFFYDLGGHSLSAAQIVSKLRRIAGLQDLSVLDLYRYPTVKTLAKALESSSSCEQTAKAHTAKHHPSRLGYYVCGVGQFLGCLLQYAIGAWQLLAVVLCYVWAQAYASPLLGIPIFLLLVLGMPIISMSIVVAAKWLLIGRVKPGTYKLWSWFYYRWWLVQRLQNTVFSPNHLIGTPLIALYYRLLGAKIGKNCYIGTSRVATHDLLTIGDNTSIGLDACLRGYIVEDGWLKIGTIDIGNHCFVGARSVLGIHSVMGDFSGLDDMSIASDGKLIASKAFYSGSPARQTTPPNDHMMHACHKMDETKTSKNMVYGIGHYLCLVFVMTVYYTCYFPALWFASYFDAKMQVVPAIISAATLGAITFLGLYYFCIGVCKKVLMNKIKPGAYPLKGSYYLRQWTIVKMLDMDAVAVMADALYFPYVLRWLGAKLGKRVEMGTTPHLLPDLITIQDEGFTASSVALAWPCVYEGTVRFAPVQIGKRGFVGNESLLPSGAKVGNGGLLGCMSITPPNDQASSEHTSWLGSPAIFLPKREILDQFSEGETFSPSKLIFYQRLSIELVRIILPTVLTLVGLFSMLYVVHAVLENGSIRKAFWVLPLVEAGLALGLVGVVVVLKWLVIGRLKASTKPLWSAYIWKIDLIEYAYTIFVKPHLVDMILGSPFMPILLRCFGAKVGKRAFIDTPEFAEFDLTSLGDEVCLNAETVIQTHLYEDRVFKTSTIHIQNGCNVGVASVVLYDTVMENNATLGSFSLLMKGEHLPENTSWQGIPAQSVRKEVNVISTVAVTNLETEPFLLETEQLG